MRALEKPRIFGLAVKDAIRNGVRALRTGSTSLSGFSAFIPRHLAAAPIDLRTTDPTMAQEFYKGIFALGGKVVETGGKSPFLVPPPGGAWLQRLHEFAWLRHLSNEKAVLSNNFARSLVKDWLDLNAGVAGDLAWDPDVVARRLISWLSNSPAILSGSEHEFHQQFMRGLGAHARFLKRHAKSAPDGMPRLMAMIALAYAAVCMTGQKRSLRNAHNDLAAELTIQVSADGGHQTRNPAACVELLTYLLPLKETYLSVGLEPPLELAQAIDRLFFALRVFRLGDGNLVRFNGSGIVSVDLVATLLRYDDSHTAEPFDATCGGFERLAYGGSVLVADTGDFPKGELSINAHAGCLSFEFSSADECLIINCGTPPPENRMENEVWRSSAAHSTATIGDQSFCLFQGESGFQNVLTGQIYSAALQAEGEREENKISASHKGYVREFGLKHHRVLKLEESGTCLSGQDEFAFTENVGHSGDSDRKITIRFHLPPDVRVTTNDEKNSVQLVTRKDQRWIFSCMECKPEIEESIVFATTGGPRKTSQIVLAGTTSTTPSINWKLQCL